MSREVRMVPPTWQHPRDERGKYIPLLRDFKYTPAEIAEGLRDGWLVDDPPHYGCDVMPQWPAEEATHYQMYESCSEGTPISPPMASAEELAHWLAENEADAFAGMTATYEQWLRTIKRGGSLASAALCPDGTIKSGVEL